MTTPVTPLCMACSLWLGEGPSCVAFERIPDGIWTYGGDHRQSIDGEATFELLPGEESVFEAWLQLK